MTKVDLVKSLLKKTDDSILDLVITTSIQTTNQDGPLQVRTLYNVNMDTEGNTLRIHDLQKHLNLSEDFILVVNNKHAEIVSSSENGDVQKIMINKR
ncbi:hypothetical protein [Paenibacillus sp. Soil750]|uniref:hypothetical protein n=1 Tax=Paenibacillus sp. Soil750 TaxID=1736398 RepID=UPI0006F98F28|nr:hypothetical protein [Paenibacillus sp. Soil750]KRE70774.1 hypothetical protein ASL11_10795 [Paenibacillus sp. Soil750]